MKMCLVARSRYTKTLNNKGFTMVAMIISFFFAFLFIVSFIPLSFRFLYEDGFVEERFTKTGDEEECIWTSKKRD